MDLSSVTYHPNTNPESLIQLESKLEPYKKENLEWCTKSSYWTNDHMAMQELVEKIVPNTHVVAILDDNSHAMKKRIYEKCTLRIVNNDLIFNQMRPCYCHNNVSKLFKKGLIKEFHSGFALMEDREWRFHSWGVDFDDKIIETTLPRQAYLTFNIKSK